MQYFNSTWAAPVAVTVYATGAILFAISVLFRLKVLAAKHGHFHAEHPRDGIPDDKLNYVMVRTNPVSSTPSLLSASAPTSMEVSKGLGAA